MKKEIAKGHTKAFRPSSAKATEGANKVLAIKALLRLLEVVDKMDGSVCLILLLKVGTRGLNALVKDANARKSARHNNTFILNNNLM